MLAYREEAVELKAGTAKLLKSCPEARFHQLQVEGEAKITLEAQGVASQHYSNLNSIGNGFTHFVGFYRMLRLTADVDVKVAYACGTA